MPFADTSTASTKQRNKLRRRRRPSPLRSMTVVVNGAGAGHPTPTESVAASSSPTLLGRYDDKDDPQTQVIASLRDQIQDLISQVTQLNGKLIKSYDRVSNLEDELHISASTVRANSLKISHLEIERAQHLASLNTGLYVEKAHVTAELTRLMERATDEAAARGQAESARQNIEQELDDLSANLFDQANTMVAEARYGRAMSERKALDAEMALKSAEDAVGIMQIQMQSLRDEKERTADENARLRALMEKGKYVEHPPITSPASLKFLSLHAPYQEFLLFVAHLRSVRLSSPNSPHISTLLPLPFLARIQTEDSDPTVRLDYAPSLNWLSRRSVLSAIHNGQLTIEPMSASTLLLESSSSLQSMIPGSQPGLSCALCGAQIFPTWSEHTRAPPPSHPLSLSLVRHASGFTNSSTWSTSLFKNPLSSNSMSVTPSPPLTPPPYTTNANNSNPSSPANPTTVYVFRLAQTHAPQHPSQSLQKPTNYPLCGSGWCLARLRTTCSLWAFVRAGVIDRVWEEDLLAPPAPPSVSSASVYSVNISTVHLGSTAFPQRAPVEKEKAPPLPPRRRSKMGSVGASVGTFWGMASGALRSQPASPLPEKEKDTAPASSEPPPKFEFGKKQEGLSVTVPPPLPRRSGARADESLAEENPSKNDVGDSDSPSDANQSETSEQTPVARSKGRIPAGDHITASNSQSSSAPSGTGDEFTTPVEEMSSSPLFFADPPVTATSSVASTSPLRSPRTSVSPPRSPRRVSSPPPRSPRSPRSVPLPDSRPVTPHRSHSRSTSVTIAPLNIAALAQTGDGSISTPSRAASPAPALTGSPPPVPRRAAARRAVPPPPHHVSVVPQATPIAASGKDDVFLSEDRKFTEEAVTEAGRAADAGMPSAPEDKPRASTETPRLPPPLPRRTMHAAQTSVSSVSKANGASASDSEDVEGDEKIDEKQERPRKEKRKIDADTGAEGRDGVNASGNTGASAPVPYVGEGTWEERTWKQIVRLREDMFWARIGGVRG